MAEKIIAEKEDTHLVSEDPSKGYILRQKWDYTDSSPVAILEQRCDELLPAAFIAGYKDWVKLAFNASLGITMTLIDNVEGFDIIRQFTPAPWGSMVSNRSAVSCIY